MDELQGILSTVLTAVVTGLLGILFWYLKSKMGVERLASLKEQATTFVEAAELIGAQYGMEGLDKKKWVVDRLVELFPWAGEEIISAIIEQAVYDLKLMGGELVQENGAIVRQAYISRITSEDDQP